MSTAFSSVTNSRTVPGNRYMTQVTLTGPTSYTSGGIAYTPSTFGLDYNVDAVVVLAVSGGLLAQWDRANQKIKLLYPTGGASAPATVTAPVAGAPGLGTLGGTATPASGATAVTSTSAQPAIPLTMTGAPTAPALTAGIGKEVAASTDVSSITIECLAFGY
jgi:hypothetical protein